MPVPNAPTTLPVEGLTSRRILTKGLGAQASAVSDQVGGLVVEGMLRTGLLVTKGLGGSIPGPAAKVVPAVFAGRAVSGL